MDYPLSSINIIPLSGHISELSIDYVNSERGINWINNTLSSYSFMNDIEDFFVDVNSLSILTKSVSLSSVIELTDVLRSYYFVNDISVENNISTSILSSTSTENQFLITAPLSSHLTFNIIPLKNSMLNSEEYQHTSHVRYYDGIYKIDDDVFLQYKSNLKGIKISPDERRIIYFPEGVATQSISSLQLIENGLFGGSCPANSDNIELDRFGYSDVTDSGYTGIDGNGELLCLWASGDTLMERWYDPLTTTQFDAYIATKADSEFNSIIDIPTSVEVGDKTKLIISRIGPNRNETFIDGLSSNLLVNFETWDSSFKDSASKVDGFIIGDYFDQNAEYLEMDGTIHGHVSPNDILHMSQNITNSLWVYSDNWTQGIDTQFWGNFSNAEGYGLFYNTGATNELITFPSSEGVIYGFNFRGYKIFDKKIASLSASDFEHIATDYFGNRWIYDKSTNQVIKLSSDDIVAKAIPFTNDIIIKSIKIDAQNIVHVQDTTTNILSSFDINGEFIESIPIPSPNNNFDIDIDNQLVFGYGNFMTVDSENNIYTIIGKNVYKNGNIWYHIYERIQTLKLDSNDNVYIFSGKHTLLKLDSSGGIIWNKTIDYVDVKGDDNVEMNFVKEYVNGRDFDVLWIVFNNNKILLKVNSDGVIVKRINLVNVVNLRNCGNFNLNVRGDFTGFDLKRKFEPATSNNPAFSLKMNLKCGNNTRILQQYVSAKQYQKGWTHLAFAHKLKNGQTIISFYIDGIKQVETILEGNYLIDYGTKVSPFIIGGNSGKLGAKNVERSLNNSGFFKGRISDIKLYNKAFSSEVIISLSRNKYWNKWKSLLVAIPTPPRTYLEKIERFHLNKYPGLKSNKFNLRISGIPENISQDSIVNFINSRISSIKPAHTILNSIIFESLPTPLSPNPILSTWLLRDGIWDDLGLWNDDETWNDG